MAIGQLYLWNTQLVYDNWGKRSFLLIDCIDFRIGVIDGKRYYYCYYSDNYYSNWFEPTEWYGFRMKEYDVAEKELKEFVNWLLANAQVLELWT